MASCIALAMSCSFTPLHAQGQRDQPGADERPLRSPKSQAMILSLPVLRDGSPIGEIEASVDRSGVARFESASLTRVFEPFLSETGRAQLARARGTSPFVAPSTLQDFGFDIRFDMGQLEVVVESIRTELLLAVDLPSAQDRVQQLEPTIAAADFSAYLNLAGTFEYSEGDQGEGFRNPEILAFGTARAGQYALQYDGGLTEDGADGYKPYRRFVRGLYDIEPRNMRISAGDLQAETLGILGTQLIGGVGIERSRRLFDPFDPVFRLGGRRLRIDSPSTIEIVNNGEILRSISVDQGIYDLEDLPLVFGSNDVDIVIRDAAGRTSVTNFNYFYDPVDLEVGDYEFGAYAGFISSLSSLQPEYDGELAATGFYRRAFTPSLLVGGAMQLSEDVQSAAAEVNWTPQVVPGVIQSQFSLSSGSKGVGYAARVGYRWATTTVQGSRQVSVIFDYEDPNFELLGRSTFLNQGRLSASLSYGQSFSARTYISSGVNYFKLEGSKARQTVFADVIHQFTPQLRGTIGAEYGSNDGFDSSFGVRAGITWLFGTNSRADAAYESRRDLYRLGINRGLEDHVGAFGYDASIQSSDGRATADAAVRYRGNRFDGRFAVSGNGDGFGNVIGDRRVQLQLATSLAYADGGFGVGRPISDGFAVVSPHPNIDGEAIVGNDLNNGEYQGRSGLLGAAVVSNISGYQTREIAYDIDTTETVFDIGNGLDRLRLPTGGGAKITVGSARYVSAVGTLVAGDEPVALISGTVTSASDDGFEPLPFFTNSVGRYSVIGLAAGESYRVRLRDGREFVLDVPAGNKGLYKVATVAIEEASQ